MAQPLRGCTVLNVEDMANEMMGKMRKIGQRRRQPSICRVLASVRNQDPTAYDPQVISIGPFHRGNPRLSSSEDLKWQYLDDLLLRHPEADLQSSLSRIGDQLENIQREYSEGFPDIKDDAFVEMMVLDGCFILELMIKIVEKVGSISPEPNFKFSCGKWYLPKLLTDLVMLENQIPFIVLENLFDAMVVKKTLDGIHLLHPISSARFTLSSVADLAYYTNITNESPQPPPSGLSNTDFLHLLHLNHSSCVFWGERGNINDAEYSSCSGWWPPYYVLRWMRNKMYFLSFLVCSWAFSLAVSLFPCRPVHDDIPPHPYLWFIPSATKLREAGVRFKKKGSVRSRWRLSVTFSEHQGCIELPFQLLEGGSNSFLRNMLAFEQSCDVHGISNYFTSYCGFLSCLVDTEEDVDILEESGIMCNFLGNRSEVATLFDRVIRGACLEESMFTEVAAEVNKYCESPMHRWRARLVRDYFNSPWSLISLVAAIVLLILTVIQTIYTVYSYYRT